MLYVLVWLLACISLVLCQDGVGTNDATKSSIQSELSKLQDSEVTTSQKPSSTVREEQIEDELSNGATTTEKFVEKRKFIVKPTKENEELRETFTVRYNDTTGPTTMKSSLSSTKRAKTTFTSSFKKYDDPEDVTDGDDVDFTTSFDGLMKKLSTENGERKTRQRLDGLKGVTTNRGKTRYQNEPGTSEVPEISSTLRHKKPIRVKPIEININDDVISTSTMDDLIDTTTIMSNFEIEQQRPKFKKPPLIATHHPNFGTSTESSRRPAIRPNISLKQKISSSTIKTKQPEPEVTEPENIITSNATLEVPSNSPSNKIRPFKVTAHKGSTVQQPIPPTATAWALASLKAPNTTNRVFRKPLNTTGIQEQGPKIKPFVTWSTRLQKINEENSNSSSTQNNTSVIESNEVSTTVPIIHVSSESSPVNRLTPEITTTESLRHMMSTLSNHFLPYVNNSTGFIIGGDTDQNKYEVYGSQKPDVENTTTIIETLRPSSSTVPSESQNSNLLLVTSYKSIFENDNSSEPQSNVYLSSRMPLSTTTKKEFTNDESITTTTDRSNVFKKSEETPTSVENVGDRVTVGVQTSTETFNKAPEIKFDYTETHSSMKIPTTTLGNEPSSSDVAFSFSDGSLSNPNQSTTTEHYIESIKTKLDDKITDSIGNHDTLEMVDFAHMFSSERPVSSSTDGADMSTVSEKTTSGIIFYFS